MVDYGPTADAAALLARYDRPGPRYTSYPPANLWRDDIGAADLQRALQRVGRSGEPLALYAHFPFCARKCLYCGCNATVTRQARVVDEYLDDLERELDLVVAALGTRAPAVQLHWGGGTPNFLDDAQLARAAALYRDRFAFTADAEWSVECDPRLVTPSQLTTLRAAGFRRLSYGVQDLDGDVQVAIGRPQDEALVRRTVAEARAAGFEGLNLDLMYGLPLQTPETFARTLDAAIDMRPERLAVFGYAHVPWLKVHQARIDAATLPDGPARFVLWRLAVERLTAAGYRWLGLDHFAVADDPLTRAFEGGTLHRNFMGYTTMPASHLVGTGCSAISDVDGLYAQGEPKLGAWRTRVRDGALPVVRGWRLGDDERARRAAIMRLMCELALPVTALGDDADTVRSRLVPLADDGLVTLDEGTIRVTTLGRWFLRNVCMALDALLPARDAVQPWSRTV
ncbi:MAG: oxygen-independent coproporphyrinogen III oxidase [Gemmatimonadaceae bacterium]|nr:oxygen-independent coproporphyrinogen III oxidase [Gemmatimonadaceae bacterium]